MQFDPAENEGLAISKSNGYRTKRPKRRPKKTKGHGIKPTWKETLRNKKEKKLARESRPLAVQPRVPVPDFLARMLKFRPEAKSQLTAEDYAALKSQGNG